ncbi:hypothetical protein ACOSQ2_020124 [Xanthoceras sorbifolium]
MLIEPFLSKKTAALTLTNAQRFFGNGLFRNQFPYIYLRIKFPLANYSSFFPSSRLRPATVSAQMVDLAISHSILECFLSNSRRRQRSTDEIRRKHGTGHYTGGRRDMTAT